MIKNLLLITLFFHALTSTAQYDISATMNSPVEAGKDLTLNITYNAPVADAKIFAGVELKDSSGAWKANVVEKNLDPVVSAGTNQTGTIVLTIPAGTTPSADLTNGDYYDMKIEIYDGGWNWKAGVYPKVTIAAAGSLSVSEANNAPASIYPNPATDMVNILPINGATFSAYKVIDITGKTPLDHSGDDVKNIDVSNLARGIYFLQLNDYNPIKFIKK